MFDEAKNSKSHRPHARTLAALVQNDIRAGGSDTLAAGVCELVK